MSKKFLALALTAFAIAGVASAATASDMGMTTLRKGSKGMYVSALQSNLNMCAGKSLSTDGAFGNGTATAVMSFQASKGLKADGIVGAATKAALAAACGSTTTTTTGTTTTTTPGCTAGALFSSTTGAACTTTTTTPAAVSGTDGTLSSVVKLGTYNNTKVNEGAKDVMVYAFEATAKDADLKIDGLTVSFANNRTTGSYGSSLRFTRVASEVSVWVDGVETGRKLASAFSHDSGDKYVYRFTGMNGVVKMNTKSRIVVAITPVATFDTADTTGDSWAVAVGTLGGSSASNAVGTFATQASTAGSAVSPNGRYRDFSLDSNSISTIDFQKATGDATFKVTTGSANPIARTIQVSKTADTNNVTLLAFDMKAENAAMLLQKLPISLTVASATPATSAQTVIKNLKLFVDGTEIDSQSATSGLTGTVTFGNLTKLQKALASNTTAKVEIKADLASRGTTAVYAEGTTISASYAAATVELDNANRDTVTNMTGSVTGELQTLRTLGVQVTMGTVSTDSTSTTAGLVATRTFTIPVKIKALDDTIYVGKRAMHQSTALSTTLASNTMDAIGYTIEDSTGAATATFATPSATWTSSDASSTLNGATESFRVDSGTERTFNLVVTLSDTSIATNGQYRIQLHKVQGFTDSGLTAGNVVAQDLLPATTYETPYYVVATN